MNAYQIIKLLIKFNRTQGLQEKVNIFFACNQLTSEQYTELTGVLSPSTSN